MVRGRETPHACAVVAREGSGARGEAGIGETTRQALLGEDFSLTNAFIVIATLVGIELGLSLWKQRSTAFADVLEGRPLVLVADGHVLKDRMDEVRVDVDDILAAGREFQCLERLDQIKYAVLERNGGISIIPKER